MTLKRPKAASSRKSSLSVIAPVAGNAAKEIQRLAQAAKACGPAQWILVDQGDGLASRLQGAQELKALKAEVHSAPEGSSLWGAYGSAASLARFKTCLLLSPDFPISPAVLESLRSATSSAEIVYSSRLLSHPWAFWVLEAAWKLPGLDFGSPVMIAQQRLLSLSANKNAASLFLGPRLAKEAILAGASLRQCPPQEALPWVDGFSVLGESALASKRLGQWVGYAGGAALIFLAFAFVLRLSNFLGLSLIAVAAFMIGSVFGREK
jgi:hypothetical protein